MCDTEIKARRVIENAIEVAGEAAQGWWVLDSLPIRIREGNTDCDVLVGVPNVGVLIIEVKGWTEFEVDDDGRWSYPGKSGTTVQKGRGPYDQAERQEYLLLGLLNELRQSGGLVDGRLPKIGSRVLFGNLDSTADFPALIDRETFFRDTFCPPGTLSPASATALLNRIRAALADSAKPDRQMLNNSDRLDEIRRALQPTCKVNGSGLNAFVNHAQIQLDDRTLTALGERAEGYSGNRLFVEGAAGTGKTCYALKLASERSQQTGESALFVCFSERLANEIRMTEWVSNENILVGTPEEILINFGQQEAIDHLRDQEKRSSDAASEAAALMGVATTFEDPRAYLGNEEFWNLFLDVSYKFCAVVVDEAQDLSEGLLDALTLFVGPDDLFAVFADPRQVTRRERSGLEWQRPDCVKDADYQKLTRNYRNGDRIIDKIEYEVSGLTYRRPDRGASPAEVNIKHYRRSDEIAPLVKEVTDALTRAELNPTVLVTGVHSAQLDEINDLKIDFSEVDGFKGLERKCMVLVVGPDANPLDPNREELYVGLSRATTYLSVITRQDQSN